MQICQSTTQLELFVCYCHLVMSPFLDQSLILLKLMTFRYRNTILRFEYHSVLTDEEYLFDQE